jgi:hypothetical protein
MATAGPAWDPGASARGARRRAAGRRASRHSSCAPSLRTHCSGLGGRLAAFSRASSEKRSVCWVPSASRRLTSRAPRRATLPHLRAWGGSGLGSSSRSNRPDPPRLGGRPEPVLDPVADPARRSLSGRRRSLAAALERLRCGPSPGRRGPRRSSLLSWAPSARGRPRVGRPIPAALLGRPADDDLGGPARRLPVGAPLLRETASDAARRTPLGAPPRRDPPLAVVPLPLELALPRVRLAPALFLPAAPAGLAGRFPW